MINMTDEQDGLIAQIKKEGWNEGEKDIIFRLLKQHSIREISNLLDMGEQEIVEIIID